MTTAGMASSARIVPYLAMDVSTLAGIERGVTGQDPVCHPVYTHRADALRVELVALAGRNWAAVADAFV